MHSKKNNHHNNNNNNNNNSNNNNSHHNDDEKHHKNHKMSKKMLHHHVEYEATFHGLQEWYKKKVEKLGWMVLAHHKGNMDKVKHYLKSMERLKLSLEHKITHIKDEDKKEDLEIMLENLMVIIDHAKKDFDL